MKEDIVHITRCINSQEVTLSVSVHIPYGLERSGQIFERTYRAAVRCELKEQYGLPYYCYIVSCQHEGKDYLLGYSSPEEVFWGIWRLWKDDSRKFAYKIIRDAGLRGTINWPTYGFAGNSIRLSLW